MVLIPERVAVQYLALHRPLGSTWFSPPQMWIARSHDLIHWGQHQYLYGGDRKWETKRVGPALRRSRLKRAGSKSIAATSLQWLPEKSEPRLARR